MLKNMTSLAPNRPNDMPCCKLQVHAVELCIYVAIAVLMLTRLERKSNPLLTGHVYTLGFGNHCKIGDNINQKYL